MLNLEEKERIVDLRGKGCSLEHIKKQTNRSVPTIRKVLKEHENSTQNDKKRTEEDEEGEEKLEAIQEYLQISDVINYEHTLRRLKKQVDWKMQVEDDSGFIMKLEALRDKTDWILDRIENEIYENLGEMVKTLIEEADEVAELKTFDMELKNKHYRLLAQNEDLEKILKKKNNDIEKLAQKEQVHIETLLKFEEEIRAKKMKLDSMQKEVETFHDYNELKKEIEWLENERTKKIEDIGGIQKYEQLELFKKALEMRIGELMLIDDIKRESIGKIIPTFVQVLPQEYVDILSNEVLKRQQQDIYERKKRAYINFFVGKMLSYDDFCLIFK